VPPARWRKLATRAYILEVAKQQLETPDFDGTSIRGLAQAAGVAELELSSACNIVRRSRAASASSSADGIHTFLGAAAAT
jgi:hypothetical protein